MKLIKILFCIWPTTLAVLSYSVSAAQLIVPEHLQVLAINGEKQPIQFMIRSREYTLPAGVASLKLRYKDLIESDDDDSHETISSAPFDIYFKVDEGVQVQYQLTAKRPSTIDESYRFARKPKIQILSNGTRISLIEPHYETVNDQMSSNTPDALDSASQSEVKFQLERWWQQASDETRAAFLKKVETKVGR